MVPQILLNVLQTGGKYFFDLDPTMTEQLTKHMVLQTVVIGQSVALALQVLEGKCADTVMPLIESVRSLKMHVSGS